MSTWAIEKKLGFTRSRVFNALKKHNIPTRTVAESHIKYKRSDFRGNLVERAYMIGFAIGDLRVRNHNGKNSETISIGCGSTKNAQVDLIEGLFSYYGRVWKGKPNARGVINIEAFVNKSFFFLLPERRDYAWCGRNKNHFFAFLAGFTDAEGSFYISNGKAFIAWGNYDEDILYFIRKGLITFGIETPKIYCDSLRGYVGTHGYKRNKNYCHVSICRKTEIDKLLRALKPYLRHKDKLQKLAVVEKNIKLRST